MTSMLDAALAYAARGWPIFPVRSDKKPMIDAWQMAATTDPAQIRRWWGDWPKANIALHVGDAGLMVLDYDPGSSKAELEKNVGPLPKTNLTAKTPRGGTHEYYALAPDEIVPNSASKLATAVDVRSFHGYVLLPPSRTSDGAYSWVAEGRPAYRPDELRRLASTAREKSQERDTWIIDPDLPENVDACIKWLREDAKISIEGQGGDSNAYATAAMCKSYGISQELAFDLMWEHWNPRCSPPWSADEADHLEGKVANGYSYNTSPPGNLTAAYKVARDTEGFKPVIKATRSGGRDATAGRFRFIDRAGMCDIPPASWLIKDVLTEEGHALIFGAPGTFKTFVALDMALSIATGFPEGSIWSGKIVRPGPVLFIVGEGRATLERRVRAWEMKHWGGERIPADRFVLADPVPSAGNADEWGGFCDGALEMAPDGFALTVLDTVGRSMAGLNENAQQDASQYTKLSERLRYELGGAHLGIHHTGLEHSDRERGSNVFAADADTRLRLERNGKEDIVRLTLVKQKDGDDDLPPWLIHVPVVELEPATETTPAITSRAAMIPDKAAQFTVAEREAKKAVAKVMEKIDVTILDNAVMAVLEGNKTTDWTTRALALEVARREDIGQEPRTLQNTHLPRLAANKDARSFHCFESKPSPRWRYRSTDVRETQ